nr:reverse transcriptase domain-containing protein [Tanacetum cinerariifolium]
ASRLHDQKLRDKDNDQKEKIFKIFQDLNFNIIFADALTLMPRFGPTIKTLLTNKDKLYELARTPLNEHCSVVLLKKLPEKLGDPSKFLISCDFPGMDECLALADLDASINLMPLSVWNKLSLPELSPTCMTLELANRSISRLVGVVEDVFLKTKRALIDVFEGELTLRVGKEAITFNLDQTSRYSANYNDMTSTNGSSKGLNDRSNNGLRIQNRSFSLDNRRLDVFGASVISRRHRVLCYLGLTFTTLGREEESQLAVKESVVDEPELGNPGIDKPVLDKLEADLDHD